MPHAVTTSYRILLDVIAFYAPHEPICEVSEVYEDGNDPIKLKRTLYSVEHELKSHRQIVKRFEDVCCLHFDLNGFAVHSEHEVVVRGQFVVALSDRDTPDMDFRLLRLFPEQVFPDFSDAMRLEAPSEQGRELLRMAVVDQDRRVSCRIPDEGSGDFVYRFHDLSPSRYVIEEAETDDHDDKQYDPAYDW